MADEQDDEQAPGSARAERAASGHHDLLSSVPVPKDTGGSESLITVLVAFAVNVLIAVATSDPTLRAVFAEDAAALVGLVIAGAALGAHQLTGSPVPDAAGSILVGVLLGVVAILLINRNLRFLVGQEVDPRVRAATIAALLAGAVLSLSSPDEPSLVV